MSLLDGWGLYLDGLGIGTWRDSTVYQPGEVAITTERIPQTPDQCIAITGYEGNEVPSRQSVDEPRVQFRVRGTTDPRASRDRAKTIYDALQGLAHVTLPDGTYLVLAYCLGTPAYMGRDDNERHEHVVNVACSVHNPNRMGVK